MYLILVKKEWHGKFLFSSVYVGYCCAASNEILMLSFMFKMVRCFNSIFNRESEDDLRSVCGSVARLTEVLSYVTASLHLYFTVFIVNIYK